MNRAGRRWWAGYAWIYDWLWDGPVSDALAGAVSARIDATGETVIDAGTGTGLLAGRLGTVGPVIGLDSSAAMLVRAARRPGCWILGSAAAPPLRPRCCATVVAANLVHLCPDPGAVISALTALLRPGGRLILTWPPEDVGPVRLARAEIAYGSAAPAVFARLAARVVVAATAAATGVIRRTPEIVLAAAVGTAATHLGLNVDAENVLGGLQHVTVLTAPEVEEPCPTNRH